MDKDQPLLFTETTSPIVSNELSMFEATGGWQFPLFSYFPLWMEFDRARERSQRLINRQPLSQKFPTQECIKKWIPHAQLDPLELQQHDLELSIQDVVQGDGEGDRTYCLTARIPYLGDERLWHLDPGLEAEAPSGEIFRGDLIIIEVAWSREEGERQIAERLKQIDVVLSMQRRLIAEYHEELPGYIAALLGGTAPDRRMYH